VYQQALHWVAVGLFEARLGTAGGFKIVVQDRGDTGLAVLQENADKVVAACNDDPRLRRLFTSFRADVPWVELLIDREQAEDDTPGSAPGST
jgi:multidrug efflux pump